MPWPEVTIVMFTAPDVLGPSAPSHIKGSESTLEQLQFSSLLPDNLHHLNGHFNELALSVSHLLY